MSSLSRLPSAVCPFLSASLSLCLFLCRCFSRSFSAVFLWRHSSCSFCPRHINKSISIDPMQAIQYPPHHTLNLLHEPHGGVGKRGQVLPAIYFARLLTFQLSCPWLDLELDLGEPPALACTGEHWLGLWLVPGSYPSLCVYILCIIISKCTSFLLRLSSTIFSVCLLFIPSFFPLYVLLPL